MDKVEVEVEITDEDFLILAKMAHKRDITFNQLAEEIIKEAMNDFDKNRQ